MDTTEERNGTYFYRGHPNLSKIELLNVIFLKNSVRNWGLIRYQVQQSYLVNCGWVQERSCRQLLEQVLSQYARILMRCTHAFWYFCSYTSGVRMQKSNKLAAIIARWVPWIGWASLSMSLLYGFRLVPRKCQNSIAKPQDRIKWISF